MKVISARFGPCEVDSRWVFRLAAPLPGFEGRKRFAVLEIPEYLPLRWFQSLEDTQLCLPVIDAPLVRTDYEVQLSDSDAKVLRLERAEDACVFVIVVLAQQVEGVRVNLRAPIVCNLRERLAMQVVLNDPRYSVRCALLAPSSEEATEEKACSVQEVLHAGA